MMGECLRFAKSQKSHGDDAVSHTIDLREPVLVKGHVVQDLRGNAGSENGWVGVHRADKETRRC